MSVIEKVALIIEMCEGYRDRAYQDSKGVWTIGYGTTYIDNEKVQEGTTCTREDALDWLAQTIAADANFIHRHVTVDLTENQAAALIDFSYNVGLGNFQNSTLLKKLNEGDYDGAANEFERWNKSGGKVLSGLIKRRAAEKNLFLSSD